MRIHVVAAAAALLWPTVSNAQSRTFVMPRGYEEVVPPEPSAAPLFVAPQRGRTRVTQVASRLNMPLEQPVVVTNIPNGPQRFTSGVACSSEFQVMQIAQGIEAAATTPNRSRRQRERSQEVAITHQVDMRVCERFENRGYTVVGTGVYDHNRGAHIPFVEVERTPEDGAAVSNHGDPNRLLLIYVTQ